MGAQTYHANQRGAPMSAETLEQLETALRAHFDDVDPDGGILTGWAVVVERQQLRDDLDEHGRDVVGYCNDYAVGPISPNTAAGLADWLAATVGAVLVDDDDIDDD